MHRNGPACRIVGAIFDKISQTTVICLSNTNLTGLIKSPLCVIDPMNRDDVLSGWDNRRGLSVRRNWKHKNRARATSCRKVYKTNFAFFYVGRIIQCALERNRITRAMASRGAKHFQIKARFSTQAIKNDIDVRSFQRDIRTANIIRDPFIGIDLDAVDGRAQWPLFASSRTRLVIMAS